MMQEWLPQKLRVLRAERGLTLEEAAEITGVTRETLGLLERGKRRPHTPTISKIARGYEIPVEELLEEPAVAGKAEAPSETGLTWFERVEQETEVLERAEPNPFDKDAERDPDAELRNARIALERARVLADGLSDALSSGKYTPHEGRRIEMLLIRLVGIGERYLAGPASERASTLEPEKRGMQ